MARAPALQAGGQGFDSLILHCRSNFRSSFIDIIKGNEISVPTYNRGSVRLKKVIKSVWGMPRLLEAKKDVVSCEKSRGFANEN